MRNLISFLTLLLLALATGCGTGVSGGKPQLPLSKKGGTTRTFVATQPQILQAITNAFADFSYRGMAFHGDAEPAETHQRNGTTNGFELLSLHDPVAKVPVDEARTKWVPYIADFHIVVTPLSSTRTMVTVVTTSAEVIGGSEPLNFHGGTANHYRSVPPVRQEEENVLAAISVGVSRINQAN